MSETTHLTAGEQEKCTTPDCPGDYRYAAPGRRHIGGCTYPLPADPDAGDASETTPSDDWWRGYSDGREEAETGDLAYNAVVDRAERAERELAARDAAILGLAAEWDALSKGETGTTKRLRELLPADANASPRDALVALLLAQARASDEHIAEAVRLRTRVEQLERHATTLLAMIRQRAVR